ncbi:MAG: NCS2 family permease [Verrucomicrobiae bacterium]|nr:NCS2 family permease [Verrucomicrobiae bacterium]
MFRLAENGTTITRELLAGVTTFAAMAYILVVNPDMLAITGMDRGALLTATALAAATGSILMAVLTNYPVALAPGMGLNAFFTFTICGQLEIPWQGALAMVFWTGILFLLLSLTKFREEVVRAIPEPLKIGIQAGIGLFIIVIGLKNLGIFANPAPSFFALRLESLSEVAMTPLILAVLGCVFAGILMRKHVPGALLIAILAVTILGHFVASNGTPITPIPSGLLSLPPSPAPLLFEADWLFPFRHWGVSWIPLLTLFFVDLFDSVGTLIGVSRRAGLVDKDGNLPRMPRALAADASATALGACFGSSTTTAYIESATGVEAGGRTGLTAIATASCFLLALFFYPVISIVPPAAVAPALLIVGALMLKSLRDLSFREWQGVIGAVTIVLLIPLNFQIAEGIAVGCIVYTILMLFSGRWREIHWLLGTLSVLFTIKLIADLAG